MKRLFRILKWGLLALLGIVGMLLIINAVWFWRASSRLNVKMGALRAAGEPTSLADLAPPPIPAEQNAETYLLRAETDVQAIVAQVNAADEASPLAEQTAFLDGRPSASLLAEMRAAFAAHPEAVPLLIQAANCPDYIPQIDFHNDPDPFVEDPFGRIRGARNVFHVLGFRVMVQLAEGQASEAFETCLAMFRLARFYDRNPAIVGELICLAQRGYAITHTAAVLGAGPLPHAAHVAVEEELGRQNLVAGARAALVSERACVLQAFADMATGPRRLPFRLTGWFVSN
ncbi:MAG TPA: hypothetical protein VMF30_07405, partial [Pirellulales bacterium]|nr:hypothetical protein [Pirellulales bacterium]